MKILTVDDSATMRRIIAGAAGVMGIETLNAANGVEALKVLEKEGSSISLILLDVNMPEMNGIELLKKVKASPQWASIPVMMVTSESERAGVIEAIQSGASSYLAKPFAPEDLIKKIMQNVSPM